MWEQLCSYNKMNFANRKCDEDEYYCSIKKALFYTLSFLIKDDERLDECIYWVELVRLTQEYSCSEDVESKFENLIINSNNAQALKYYNVFSKIKRGYGCFFSLLNIEMKSLLLDKYGLKAYTEVSHNDNKRVL